MKRAGPSRRRRQALSRPAANKVCHNCGTTTTPLWRSSPVGEEIICNACFMRYRESGQAGLERRKREVQSSDSGQSPEPKVGKLKAAPPSPISSPKEIKSSKDWSVASSPLVPIRPRESDPVPSWFSNANFGLSEVPAVSSVASSSKQDASKNIEAALSSLWPSNRETDSFFDLLGDPTSLPDTSELMRMLDEDISAQSSVKVNAPEVSINEVTSRALNITVESPRLPPTTMRPDTTDRIASTSSNLTQLMCPTVSSLSTQEILNEIQWIQHQMDSLHQRLIYLKRIALDRQLGLNSEEELTEMESVEEENTLDAITSGNAYPEGQSSFLAQHLYHRNSC